MENENKTPLEEQTEQIIEETENAVPEPPKLTFWQMLRMSKKKAKKAGYGKKTLVLLDIKEWVFSIVFAVVAVLLLITFVFRIITVDGHSMDSTLADGEKLFVTAFDVRFGSVDKGEVVICHFPGRTSPWPGESFKLMTLKTDFVKRAVGVPGDTIERKYGVTYVNGEALDARDLGFTEGYLNTSSTANYRSRFYKYTYETGENGEITYYRTECQVSSDLSVIEGEREQMSYSDAQTYSHYFDYTYTLKDDEYFVVGDNRYGSHDSRSWNGPDLPYNSVNSASGHVGPVTKSMILGHVRAVIWPLSDMRSISDNSSYIDPKDVTANE